VENKTSFLSSSFIDGEIIKYIKDEKALKRNVYSLTCRDVNGTIRV